MDEQDIPRNLQANFCDNPALSPIEFSRNSSLINNKAYTLNISYEKFIEDDLIDKDQIKNLNLDSQEGLLDSKFIEDDSSLDFSFDDCEFQQQYGTDIYQNLDEKIRTYFSNESFDDSLNENAKNSFKRKNQKILYYEAKRRSGKFMTRMSDSSPVYIKMDEEDIKVSDSNAGSSLIVDSILTNESFEVLSPIAHEMSQINGKELKDISNFFSTDIPEF